MGSSSYRKLKAKQMGGEGMQLSYHGWWARGKDKESKWNGCFEINSMFRTPLLFFFFQTCQAISDYRMVELLIEAKNI